MLACAGGAPSRKEPAAPVQPSRQVSTGPRARRAATLSGSTGSTRPLSRIAQPRTPPGCGLVPDQLAVGVAVGAGGFGAEAAELVGLVVGEVALEPHHPAVAFEGQHVRSEEHT